MFDKIMKIMFVLLVAVLFYFIGFTNGNKQTVKQYKSQLNENCEFRAEHNNATGFVFNDKTGECNLIY